VALAVALVGENRKQSRYIYVFLQSEAIKLLREKKTKYEERLKDEEHQCRNRRTREIFLFSLFQGFGIFVVFLLFAFFLFHPRDYYKLSLCVTLVIHLTVYGSLEEYITPSDVCSIKLRYDQSHESRGSFLFNRRVVLTSFMTSLCRTFFHPIGVSLAESFNLASNVWHVEIVCRVSSVRSVE